MVGVARGTLAITSDTTVEHLADSFQCLPDAHTIVKPTIPKSKGSLTMETQIPAACRTMSGFNEYYYYPLSLRSLVRAMMGRLVHRLVHTVTGLGSSSLVAHVLHYPPSPTRTAL